MADSSKGEYRTVLRQTILVAAAAGIPLALYENTGTVLGVGGIGCFGVIITIYGMALVVANHLLRHLNADLMAAAAMNAQISNNRAPKFDSPWVQRIAFLVAANAVGVLVAGLIVSTFVGTPALTNLFALFFMVRVVSGAAKLMSAKAASCNSDRNRPQTAP